MYISYLTRELLLVLFQNSIAVHHIPLISEMKFWDILFPSQGARDSQAAVFHEYLPCSLLWDTCNGVPIYDLHLGNLWPHVGCTTYTGRARSENTGKYLVSYQIVYYKMDKWKAFGKLLGTSYN